MDYPTIPNPTVVPFPAGGDHERTHFNSDNYVPEPGWVDGGEVVAMTDKASGLFAGFRPGADFNIRGANGTELVAHIEDLEYLPGDETHLPMLRGHIELRNFAFPSDALIVPLNDDGTVTISGTVKHFPPI